VREPVLEQLESHH